MNDYIENRIADLENELQQIELAEKNIDLRLELGKEISNPDVFFTPNMYNVQGSITDIIQTLEDNLVQLSFDKFKCLIKYIQLAERELPLGSFLYDSVIDADTYVRYYKNRTFVYNLNTGYSRIDKVNNYVQVSRNESGNYIADSLRKNKVTARDIETGKKVYKYVVTYRSKPILVEDTGHYITLETGCYKWVEE